MIVVVQDGQQIRCTDGEFVVRWTPRPELRIRTDQLRLLDVRISSVEPAHDTSAKIPAMADSWTNELRTLRATNTMVREMRVSTVAWNQLDDAVEIELTVVNFPDYWGTGSPVQLSFGDYAISLVPRDTEAFNAARLMPGLFYPTHTVHLSRRDGKAISRDAFEVLRADVVSMLSFAAGMHIDVFGPIATRPDGSRNLGWLRALWCSGWKAHLNWLDSFSAEADLSELARCWSQVAPDDRAVLQRLVRMVAEAQKESVVLETRLVTAYTAAEILCWVALGERDGWLDPDAFGRLTAAGRLRLLYKWAHGDAAIRSHQHSLLDLAKADSDVNDLPDALAKVRNQVVHPIRRAQLRYPKDLELREAWAALLDLAELALLRYIDFTGHVAERIFPRSPGSGAPVPWSLEALRVQEMDERQL